MQACLDPFPDDIKRVFLAYSGGLDSSVLLHLLVSAGRGYEIIPWHINHGLLDVAMQMEQFCIAQAEKYDLVARVDHLELGDIKGNIEAEARHQRYHLFKRETVVGDCVLTAHHADDQAETLLLNALRGSGTAGLRGIARRRSFGGGILLRPLLGFSRADIEDYADIHNLDWFDDPSNASNRFDRNYLRNQVIPAIRQRWPHYQDAFSTVSELQSETQDVLDEIGRIDFEQAKGAESDGIATLDKPRLLALSEGRRKNLIRYWITHQGLPVLPHNRLQELLRQLHSRPDSMPQIAMSDYSVRLYDQRLFLVRSNIDTICPGVFEFGLNSEIDIDPLELHLQRESVFELLQVRDQGQQLTLKIPGEETSEQDDRHRLKRMFQKQRVPPWLRSSVARIYLDGRLEGILL